MKNKVGAVALIIMLWWFGSSFEIYNENPLVVVLTSLPVIVTTQYFIKYCSNVPPPYRSELSLKDVLQRSFQMVTRV